MDDPIPAKVPSRWPIALLLVGAIVAVLAVGTALRFGQTPKSSGPTAGSSAQTPNPSSQESEPLPAGPISYVVGTVTAGPVCPVERSPLPSSCAPRPVAGAVITASFAGQGEIARAMTAADGSYTIIIHGYGTYTVTALPVAGLMNAPAPVTVTLAAFETKPVDFQYDTGIR
ncbi:MAG: hypothetical protein ACXWN4_01825 [Candidatus Limnocylindrales bacterium]